MGRGVHKASSWSSWTSRHGTSVGMYGVIVGVSPGTGVCVWAGVERGSGKASVGVGVGFWLCVGRLVVAEILGVIVTESRVGVGGAVAIAVAVGVESITRVGCSVFCGMDVPGASVVLWRVSVASGRGVTVGVPPLHATHKKPNNKTNSAAFLTATPKHQLTYDPSLYMNLGNVNVKVQRSKDAQGPQWQDHAPRPEGRRQRAGHRRREYVGGWGLGGRGQARFRRAAQGYVSWLSNRRLTVKKHPSLRGVLSYMN